jgi:hypothetical protein
MYRMQLLVTVTSDHEWQSFPSGLGFVYWWPSVILCMCEREVSPAPAPFSHVSTMVPTRGIRTMATSRTWSALLDALCALPRARQYAALSEVREFGPRAYAEAWNTAFGPDSLYDAWTQLPFVQSIYRHNRVPIARTLAGRTAWSVVEIGGGNGALWDGLLAHLQPGALTLIDPEPEAHEAVGRRLPGNVGFRSVVAEVGDSEIPASDVVVCSLALHHRAGRDAAQRAAFGMSGEGKEEILRRVVASVRPRQGIGILNEADCYNEIDLASGDPVLVDHFLDVYVRRTARAVAHTIDTNPDSEFADAWSAIIRHWCLDQMDYAYAARDQRDVYEHDAASWVRLLGDAGAGCIQHKYTDDWNLFQQYLFD